MTSSASLKLWRRANTNKCYKVLGGEPTTLLTFNSITINKWVKLGGEVCGTEQPCEEIFLNFPHRGHSRLAKIYKFLAKMNQNVPIPCHGKENVVLFLGLLKLCSFKMKVHHRLWLKSHINLIRMIVHRNGFLHLGGGSTDPGYSVLHFLWKKNIFNRLNTLSFKKCYHLTLCFNLMELNF